MAPDDHAILAAYAAEIAATVDMHHPLILPPNSTKRIKLRHRPKWPPQYEYEHAILAALLRSDLRYFVWKSFPDDIAGHPLQPNWHIDAIVYQLMLVQAGATARLIINQPPRSLKTICVSVAFVAWLLGHDPTRRIIVVSYSNDFAAELHRQFRMVIDAPWYRALFPRMRPAKDAGTELVTTAGGSRYATSVGGTPHRTWGRHHHYR